MRSLYRWSGQFAVPIAALALGGTLGLSGCKDKITPTPPTIGSQVPKSATTAATLSRPIAAALSPDAKTVYVTAFDSNGQAQLYSGPAGGALTVVASSMPLSYPCSIAVTSDGTKLLIADLGDAGGGGPTGAVYTSSTTGTLTALTTGTPQYPTGVALSLDDSSAYVTGVDPTDGKPGVWQIAVSGGGPVQLYKGAPLVYPAGVTVSNDGGLYVADTSGLGASQGAIFRIQDSRAFQINKTPLRMHFPVGLAPAGQGFPDLLITTAVALGVPNEPFVVRLSPDGTQQPLTLALAGGTITEPTSIHRAAKTDSWIVVDAVVPAADLAGAPGVPDPAKLDNPDGRIIQLSP